MTVKPLVDARLRYETADQDGLPQRTSDAVTVRLRTGVQANTGHWTALAEAQGNLAIVDKYYDGLHGVQIRPLVADPQNVALYRAQIQYHAPGLTLTAGRQRIALDDERFVGTAAIRNNGLRDLYASAGYGWNQIGSLKAVSIQAIYHRFHSDRLVRHYGDEIDLLASAKVGRTIASIRYADYDADLFATDTRKVWLQLDWTL